MEQIISEIAKEYINSLVEMVTSGKKSFEELEMKALTEAKKCAAKVISAYAEAVDEQVLADKKGRKEMGCVVHRRKDERKVQTLVGEVCYKRTYYKKVSGGYEYFTDSILGVEQRERVSSGLCLALAGAAKDMSYAKSSSYVCNREISRQTVMKSIRGSKAGEHDIAYKRKVPELHIDADEAHVTMRRGKNSEVPLVSVYEGIEKNGKRNSCKNVFHISEYGKSPDEFWEQVLSEIERQYDLENTKIYLHGDGAAWIQTGFEWIPNAVFVLDKYHKNKAIKTITAGLESENRTFFETEIRWALDNNDLDFLDELTLRVRSKCPDREQKILDSAKYLRNFVHGIYICKTDPCANNGGCTEPHVSHVLSARLSSRPMAWSKKTLTQLAPILASGQVVLMQKAECLALPAPLRKAAVSANKAFLRGAAGLVHPDSIGNLPISGRITGLQVILKSFA